MTGLPPQPSLGPILSDIPPFAALRAFEAIGRLGGIRKAAEALSLHHAVVSRHLSSLEAWLAMKLVDRDRPGLPLTEEGMRYHSRISAALSELSAATADLGRRGEVKHIRIWSNGGLSAKWLGAQLGYYMAANADLTIELRPTDVRPDLLRNEADVDVRYMGDAYSMPPGGKGLKTLEIARPPIIVVAGGKLGQSMASGVTLSDIRHAPMVHEEHDAQWRAWLNAYGIEVPGQLSGPRLWHAHLAIAAAAEGRGLALASTFLVEAELASGELVQVTPSDKPGPPPALGGYFVTMREERWTVAELARLRRWLEARAGEHMKKYHGSSAANDAQRSA